MIRSGLINMIREKALTGKSPYAIGKEMNISKNTAKKYIQQDPAPHKLKGIKKESKLDPYKTKIDSLMKDGIFNCEVIFEKIIDAGYTGRKTILKDYVQQFRSPSKEPAVRRYETLPGKQAQMDWGISYCVDADGIKHKLPVFVMVLGHTRNRYVEFTKRCDLSSLQRCIVNGLEYFGGVPKIILTDRMKTVIIGMEAQVPLWNSRFADFTVDIGFVIKVCKAKRPQTKGKVERLVNYVKDNFIPGVTFTDIGDLNLQAYLWCNKVNSKRHGTTGEIPLKVLARENLQPLPGIAIRNKYRWETRKVTRDGFVSYDGARYGVPWQYSMKEVRVRILGNTFEVYDKEVRIAKHVVEYGSGRIVWLKDQYKGLTEHSGLAYASSHAKIASDAVQIRSLTLYDRYAEVMPNG